MNPIISDLIRKSLTLIVVLLVLPTGASSASAQCAHGDLDGCGTVDVSDYQRKRDFLYEGLTAFGYRVFKPRGAFYMFPESPVPDEMRLVDALQRYGVLVVPGRGFGLSGYFRISFCVDQSVLDGAMPGFEAVAAGLGAPGA